MPRRFFSLCKAGIEQLSQFVRSWGIYHQMQAKIGILLLSQSYHTDPVLIKLLNLNIFEFHPGRHLK